jgi:hypothetical protein
MTGEASSRFLFLQRICRYYTLDSILSGNINKNWQMKLLANAVLMQAFLSRKPNI